VLVVVGLVFGGELLWRRRRQGRGRERGSLVLGVEVVPPWNGGGGWGDGGEGAVEEEAGRGAIGMGRR